MKSFFLLIILTQNGAGDINASFVNTETQEQCLEKTSMLEGLFMATDIPVVKHRCISSDLSFSDFVHAPSSKLPRYFYIIHFDKTGAVVEKMQDWKSCMLKASSRIATGKIYCSSSVQELMN